MVIKWIIILLAVINFGYMTYDGAQALTSGDYIRPQEGEYAGQLGPWTNIVSAIGIEPESDTMKTIFIVWGVVGLIITAGFAINRSWGWKGLFIFNILSLWYLVMGTVSSAIQLVLLFIRRTARQ